MAALLLAAAWPAAGHVGDFSEGKSFAAEPYSGTLMPVQDYIYDNRPAGLRVLLVEKAGPGFKAANRSTDIAWTASLGQETLAGSFAATTLEGQWESANTTFPKGGEWNVTLSIRGAAGNRTLSVPMMVYKQLGYRMKPVNAELDPYLDEETTLGFRQVWYDAALQPSRTPLEDVTMRIERWDQLHKVMLSSQEVQMSQTGDAWEYDHEFQETGMFHMSFASRSGGFGYEEMPIQHVFVVERPAEEVDYVRMGLIAFVALCCIVLVGYVWYLVRGRRRGD